MQLLISDTNILIDMEKGELISVFFDLCYEFCVPDVLFYEELEEQHAYLRKLGLGLRELSAKSLSRVASLKKKYAKPSTNDIFALLLAEQERCPLVSGDRDLVNAAKGECIAVHGTLWIVEAMVKGAHIDKGTALVAYKKMEDAGRRLPWTIARQGIERL